MKRLLTLFDKVIFTVSAGAAIVSASILLFVFVIIQFEVVMRFVFDSPTSWTHEVSTLAISWVGFLGAGYVLRLGRQLEIDIVTMRISDGARRLLGTLTDVIGGVFSVFIAYLGFDFVRIAFIMRATSASELDTPLWIPYLTIPIGFGVLSLEFFSRISWRWGIVERPVSDAHAIAD